MQVFKFGGTSVGSADNIQRVGEILNQTEGAKIVVLSAMSGVTNLLVQVYEGQVQQNEEQIRNGIEAIRRKHFDAVSQLFKSSQTASKILLAIDDYLDQLSELAYGTATPSSYAEIVTIGESMSTAMISEFFNQQGINNVLLNAKDFMFVGSVENPDIAEVGKRLQPILDKNPSEIYITQGFVCRNEMGTISTLKRGGSDFTATIIGAAIDAAEVQIWTDIDGLHNNDPRYVDQTRPIDHLTYNEAAELAYFGAKILHPQTVAPVIDRDIPVWLKNTFDPQAHGTQISNEYHNRGLKAISAKDGITAIKIRSNRMLGAHGFLRTIFEVFDRHETSIDMITTSEVAISLTIDDDSQLDAIVTELSVIAEITVEKEHSIICIVGENLIEDQTSYKAFGLLNNLPVRMISYGGSNNNISLLVPTNEKVNALRYLNQQLFQLSEALV